MEHSIALLEDFDLKSARILVSGADAVIDNVRRILILSDSGITVDHGKGQISVYGTGIRVESVCDGRMYLKGSFSGIEFYQGELKNKNSEE